MNAVNPLPPTAAGAEPSMEEILASIRRIIADDQSLPGHAARDQSSIPGDPPPPAATVPSVDAPQAPSVDTPEAPSSAIGTPHPLAPQAGTILLEANAPTGAEAEQQETRLEEADLHEEALRDLHESSLNLHDFATEEPPMTVLDVASHDAPAHDVSGEGAGGLFSAATSQSLAAAFNTLAVSRLAEDSGELRKLAQEMLRPMLKSWLDENLPSLVEHIIRDEIDRMSHRGR